MILAPGDRRRCYTVAQLLDLLQMAPSTFANLKRAGKLPFLEELRPRLGKHARYRADLVDRYLANQFEQRRSLHVAGRR
jgi:Helix-turn-helix domain